MKKILKIRRIDSLFRKIAFWQCAALFLFAVITGALFAFSYSKYTYERHLSQLAGSIAEAVSNHVEDTGKPVGSQDPSEIRTYTDIISGTSNMADISVWIITKDKELISYNRKTGRLEFDQLPTRYTDMLHYLLQGNSVHNDTYRKVWNRDMFGVGTPILDSGGFVIGVVLVQTSHDVVLDAMKTSMTNLAFSLLIAMLVTLCIAIIIFRIITKPLEKIQKSAFQLQEGNYEVRTNVRQDDELGRLAESVDELAIRLSEARAERDNLDKMRQTFISNISHELRTPVTTIRASLEALCEGLVTDPQKVRQYHQAMLKDSIQLHRLIHDLLDLSSLQSAEFNMNQSDLNPYELIQDALSGIRPLAEKKNITLRLDCLCETCSHCSVKGDYGRLRQLFTILLDNAVKFTPAGKTVTVSAEYSDHFVCRVVDQGCGIPAEDLPNIFSQFYRGRSSADKEGCGLGLAIAAQIAAHHDIDIHAESWLGEGTCFTLVFKD
ncbi:HAMP domain-containing histidine kinase [Anaerovorax odorimutans]|uniref:histidine kinase n=1 Tax=Anaerovorax odorimutans TaxID=109327 RepID=A0ABT1RME6_9FIRM|nr:HAMP domain-containing sensor histidine kinase [Anaerovorax odorimutans]MCQ4636347.1 HAMP domain-containing histidine kinase [Anaerovorax odorimutans]